MIRLTEEQINAKLDWMKHYAGSKNAATSSTLDANANVTNKNVATMEAEIGKDFKIQFNRELIKRKIDGEFGTELAEQYIHDLESHLIYTHDETSLMPYCVSVNMFPFLLEGMKPLGGEATAPTNLDSFCGSFINLVFAVASQFAGAVATVEFLMYFDYFAKKEFGDNYLEGNEKRISQYFQQVVYSLNQPAASRGYQCVREDTTELMTPNGFKKLSELNVGDLCYVIKDGKTSIEEIKNLNIYDFDGEMIQFKGKNYQQTVTKNHRVVYKKPNTNEYAIKEAMELVGHSKLSLPIASELEDKEDYPITDDMLKLCVFALTDGTIEVDGADINKSRLRIYKSTNRWGSDELKQMLTRNGIGFTTSKANGAKYGNVEVISMTQFDSQSILRPIMHTKKEIPHFFKLLNKRQAGIVIDTWGRLDGTNDGGVHNTLLQCDNDIIRDVMQEVVFIAGYGSEIYDRVMTKFDSNESCIVKYVKIFKRTDKRVSEYNHVQYKGRVWCPTTDAGIVVMREENGIPYITGNSVFWNISTFDEEFFNGIFGEFCFPDMVRPEWKSVDSLQRYWHRWFREERQRALLTFPVVTHAFISNEDGDDLKDESSADFVADEMSKGGEFFIYTSDSADSLASCCRLKNELTDNTFSYSLGAGGVATGSKNVITINMNRLVQEGHCIEDVVKRVQKYQVAFDKHFREWKDNGLLPVFDANMITLDKQFLTIGVNGLVEAAEYLGFEISNNQEYLSWAGESLGLIKKLNKDAKAEYGLMFNTELVPAENLGVKNAKWDRADGLDVKRDCYNSYFYIVEDEVNLLDKMVMHGKQIVGNLDGGSALHFNNDKRMDKEQYRKLLSNLIKTGCNYFCENVPKTCCNEPSCGHIEAENLTECPKCGSKNVDYASRVIGYLKKTSSYSHDRQLEEKRRIYGA